MDIPEEGPSKADPVECVSSSEKSEQGLSIEKNEGGQVMVEVEQGAEKNSLSDEIDSFLSEYQEIPKEEEKSKPESS